MLPSMTIKDKDGQEITSERLAQEAWDLLQEAKETDEIDHQVCAKYIELMSKVLLPKTQRTGSVDGDSMAAMIAAARGEFKK